MKEMTTSERVGRMYEHREADRVPMLGSPWDTTIERWRREGMPEGVDFTEYFDIDRVVSIHFDNSPRYEVRTVEETDEYKVFTSKWGVTLRQWKHAASTPEFLKFTVVDRDSWEKAKARMTPTRDRIDWDELKKSYPKWRRDGAWLELYGWFGFDVTHSWMVGTERVLIALIEDPAWCVDMFNHYLDVQLGLFEMLWEAGYTFDCLRWPDDMGYKLSQFFSVGMYRELLKPVHKRAIEWAHSKGIKALLHSCGDIRPFIPELVGIGLDGINPLEVKAGVDPVAVKAKYGKKLLLHGGVNAVLWDDLPRIEAEMRRVVPALKESGGYVFGSDHSVPSSVSLDNFRRIVELAKELGSY